MPDDKPWELRLSWRRLFAYWLVVILIVSTFPWIGGEPNWHRVRWIPLLEVMHSFRRMFDAVANVVFYIPLGLAYVTMRSSSVPRLIMEAGLLSLLLSVGCEFIQIFSPFRYPSMTDVVTNSVGGLLGAAIGGYLHGKKLLVSFER